MTVASDYICTSCFKYSNFIFNVSLSVCFKVYFFDYWWFHRLSLAHLRGLKHQIVMLWQEQRVSLLLHPCTIILCIVDLIWFEKMTISPNTTTYVFFVFFYYPPQPAPQIKWQFLYPPQPRGVRGLWDDPRITNTHRFEDSFSPPTVQLV